MTQTTPQLSAAVKELAESERRDGPGPRRQGLALCLSGGGFRAAIFHLGALRRLNELGILSKVNTICSVSGGSIVAAHLAKRLCPWPAPGQVAEDWDGRVAAPFRELTSRDLRTWPLLARFVLPWNWFRASLSVQLLAERYRRWVHDGLLRELPPRPRFAFCAADMVFGVNWVFDRDRVGDYMAGYAPSGEWLVAKAAAASSCFPPLFSPLPAGLSPDSLVHGRFPAKTDAEKRERDRLVSRIRLTDGGVYDNLGLEPVWEDQETGTILVSDGGGLFWPDPAETLWRELTRYVSIVQNQAIALRKRWLMAAFRAGQLAGTYWGVGSATERYGPGHPAGYSKELAVTRIATIRTDLNPFTQAEFSALENHGYLLAEAAVRKHCPGIISPAAHPLSVPHPEWTDEAQVRAALQDSHRRFSLRRWWARA